MVRAMSTQQTVHTLLAHTPVDIAAVAAALDGADDAARVTAVRSLSGKQQAALWDACEGRAVQLADLVPEGKPAAEEVIHAGKNSLPVFSHFEKRFARTTERDDVLYGYNEGATRPLIGPGCFVARWDDEMGSACVDYYQVPPDGAALPTGWPAVKPNTSGLQILVYANMVDHLRKVSDHVSIGRAWRKGKVTNNYFLLCRQG